ncbi:MAG: CsbD family protein [Planctomycetota bacterium]
MNRHQIAGKWQQLKGAFKQEWARLTDDDLKHAEGDVDTLVGRIVERYGDAKERVKAKLDAIVHMIVGPREPKPKPSP